MNDPIHYFVVYDCGSGEAATLELADYEAALAAYRSLRREQALLGRNKVRVLLVGGDDVMTLETVHLSSFVARSDVTAAFERPAAA